MYVDLGEVSCNFMDFFFVFWIYKKKWKNNSFKKAIYWKKQALDNIDIFLSKISIYTLSMP